MKRLIAILVAAFGLLPMVMAQETVTGVVVDKKGNPLPGVKIEIPGTPDQTISDLDGTFTINRSDITKKKALASYAGMSPRKVKLKDGMKIKMSEYNWWTHKPDEWNWFVNAVVAIPNNPSQDLMNPAYGLMLGRVKTFGYYVKGITNTFGTKTTDNLGLISKEKSTYWSATAGGIMRLRCPIHIYAGVGYASYNIYAKNLSDQWHKQWDRNTFAIDLGLMLRIKRITITLGHNFSIKTRDAASGSGDFGIGYSF